MPQWKIFYGSIIVISAVAMLLTRTIFATPVVNNKQDDTAASDLTDAAASAAAITEMGSQSNRNAEGGYGDLSTKHSVNKRSFYDISCKGIYDKTIFARVDQICEDCYSLFRAAKLHTLCRQSCFTSEYFKGCVEVLLLNDELDKIQQWIRRLNGVGV